jgi:hypothetical protein
VRGELRRDGKWAVRFSERYLPVKEGAVAEKPKSPLPAQPVQRRRTTRRGSDWNKSFDLKKAPKLGQAAQA